MLNVHRLISHCIQSPRCLETIILIVKMMQSESLASIWDDFPGIERGHSAIDLPSYLSRNKIISFFDKLVFSTQTVQLLIITLDKFAFNNKLAWQTQNQNFEKINKKTANVYRQYFSGFVIHQQYWCKCYQQIGCLKTHQNIGEKSPISWLFRIDQYIGGTKSPINLRE